MEKNAQKWGNIGFDKWQRQITENECLDFEAALFNKLNKPCIDCRVANRKTHRTPWNAHDKKTNKKTKAEKKRENVATAKQNNNQTELSSARITKHTLYQQITIPLVLNMRI